MDSFEQIGEWLFQCKTCGEKVESGIANISGHWTECTGKEFSKALMKKAKKKKLTIRIVEKLRKMYL